MRSARILLIAFGLVLCAGAGRSADGDDNLFRFDPVELASDRTVEGSPELETEHAGYRYRFANEANRTAFRADPGPYEIQLGGACARMGSLSGTGLIDLFARHDGKLYLFASEACRSTFLKSPARLLLHADPEFQPSVEDRARGRKLRAELLESIASSDRIRSLQALVATTSAATVQGGETWVNTITITARRSGEFRRDEWWNQSRYSQVVIQNDAWFDDNDVVRTMAPVQRRDAGNLHAQHFAGVLQELLNESAVAGAGETASAAETGLLQLYSNGFRKDVEFDPASKEIRSVTLRGHAPSFVVSKLTVRFRNYHDVDGLRLPVTAELEVDENEVPASTTQWTWLIHDTIDPTLFVRSGTADPGVVQE